MPKARLILLLLLGLIGREPIYAQISTADSLSTLLSNSTSDSQRLILMDELIDELINSDVKKALTYAEKSLDLSRQIGDQKNEVRALNKKGLLLYETKERSASLEYFEKSERIAAELGMKELQVHNLMSIATVSYTHLTLPTILLV